MTKKLHPVEVLRRQHAELDEKIVKAVKAGVDQFEITELKKKKLLVKDKIMAEEGLDRGGSVAHGRSHRKSAELRVA